MTLSPMQMTLALEGERLEDSGCASLIRPPETPHLMRNTIQVATEKVSTSLPLVQVNTFREQNKEKKEVRTTTSQIARIRFAPPQSNQRKLAPCVRPGRTYSSVPSTTFRGDTNDLENKRSATIRSFHMLQTWGRSMESSVLKTLLTDAYDVLFEAVYANSKDTLKMETSCVPSTSSLDETVSMQFDALPTEANKRVEYFAIVANAQESVRLQTEERTRLTTQLVMEKALEQDLSTQLQQLECDVAQLNMQHACGFAESQSERHAVQVLERDYASLIEQEQEVQRDCEILELQLDTLRAQLKETQREQAYFDIVSNAALKRHMDMKKSQEQYTAITLQVENAAAENRALKNTIKQLEEEAAHLEKQYAHHLELKQQSETALCETQTNYEQFLKAFEQTRVYYTPRPDQGRILDVSPDLSAQTPPWGNGKATSTRGAPPNYCDKQADGVLEYLAHSSSSLAVREDDTRPNDKSRTKTLVKELLHWIERLQEHCSANLHLGRIWHDIEQARVKVDILHQQLDRVVRDTSLVPVVLPNATGVTTIITAESCRLSGSPSKHPQDYIMALGTHDGVPLFLRHRGKLERKFLKKVDVENMIRKVWAEKRKCEQRNPLRRFPLEQVLYEKLHRKYGFQPLIAEWGYNLLLALQAFSWDTEIEMFLLCLTGAVSDLVYIDQEQMIQGCQKLLLGLSKLYNIESFVSERRVLLKDALVALRTFFPLKTPLQLQAIEQAIIRDMHRVKRGGNDSILYIDDILPLDVKYPLGYFIKTICTQHFREVQDYYTLLLSELDQRDTDRKGILPLAAIRDAIVAIDPVADPKAIQKLMIKNLRLKSLRESVHYKAILKKMNATCLMKFALNFDQNAEVNWRRRPGAVPVSDNKQARLESLADTM